MDETLTSNNPIRSIWRHVYPDLRRDLARDLQPE